MTGQSASLVAFLIASSTTVWNAPTRSIGAGSGLWRRKKNKWFSSWVALPRVLARPDDDVLGYAEVGTKATGMQLDGRSRMPVLARRDWFYPCAKLARPCQAAELFRVCFVIDDVAPVVLIPQARPSPEGGITALALR
jgi:hypothetical protein